MLTSTKQQETSSAEAAFTEMVRPPGFNRWLVALCLLFPALLTIWYSLDNSWPFWDAADHVRVEFQYCDLLRHARPWNAQWLKEFLTVNYCYPPSVHIFNGALKAIFGAGRWVDSLSLIIFSVVLSFSACATALLTLKSRKAAALTVTILQAFPGVALLSHLKLLDYPHLALYTCATASLLWWQRSPSWSRALLCGTALGIACTTKQIAAFFLFAPCLVVLIQQIYSKRWDRALQLAVSGVMVVLFLASWVIPNWEGINGYMHRNSGHLGDRTIWTAFLPNLSGYVNCAPGLAGYPLLILSMMSLLVISKNQLRALALPAIAAVVGIACMCALPFQLPEHRYIAPALLFVALLCSSHLCRFFSSAQKNYGVALPAALMFAAGLIQFAVMNYAPYPVALPKTVIHTLLWTDNDRRGPLEPGFNPTPPGDQWGQQWVVRESKKASGNQSCWLNMLPSTPELSVHTLALVSRYEGSKVQFTTSRLWTPTGDKIDFDGKSWLNFHFYLVKTGAQGLQFESPQSAQNYARIEKLLAEGIEYKLIATRTIADGSTLRLYGKTDFVRADAEK